MNIWPSISTSDPYGITSRLTAVARPSSAITPKTKKKLLTITKLFKDNEIRSVWDEEKEEYYFSVIDVVSSLTESPRPRKYWNALKTKLDDEGSELSSKLGQLKLKAKDGK